MKNLLITTALLLLSAFPVSAQESRTEICVGFRVNKAEIDPAYAGNGACLEELHAFLDTLSGDSTLHLISATFAGAASPEGGSALNRSLARRRLEALERLVRSKAGIPDSIIRRTDCYIPWGQLAAEVAASGIENKENVLSILKEESLSEKNLKQPESHEATGIDSRITRLKQIDGGKTWKRLDRMFFKDMRKACAVFVTRREAPAPQAVPEPPAAAPDTAPRPVPPAPEPAEPTAPQTPQPADTAAFAAACPPEVQEDEAWVRRILVKTNAVGWGLAIANAAGEIDLAPHWSFALPIYYSAWNYFRSTVKFRTFAVQPELRLWLRGGNDGWFAGAHFGLAYYNFARRTTLRYQDHFRHTPTTGGGLSVGYRLPVGGSGRWRLEFSLGAGVYPLHYDKFLNEPNGKLTETVRKTFVGIDRAAVSVAYSFGLKGKGGRK